jgi:hypothetical protein
MRNLSRLLGGLAAAGVIAGVFLWVRPSSEKHAAADSAPVHATEPGAGASEEVQRLRAELRKRDQLVASLLAASRGSAAASSTEAHAPKPQPVNREDRAAEILDDRMVGAPKDPGKAAEMERAIRDLASSPDFGKMKLASLSCGSTLCKLTLTGENEAALNQSMAEMSTHLPKLFEAAVAHRLSDGQTTMYVARARDDLAVDAPTASR